MFLAYNKTTSDKLIGAKAALLSDTIKYLPSEKIEPFFMHIRSTEETFPSDAKIIKLVSAYQERVAGFKALPEYNSSELPTPAQHKKAVKTIEAVLDGKIEKNEGQTWLIRIFGNEI